MTLALSDTGRRRAVVAVAGVVVLVLLLAVAVWLVGRDSSEAAPRPTGAAPPVTSDDSGQDVCASVAAPSEERPTAAPDDVEYEVVDGGIIPVSDTYGPADRTGPVWECFSRSPMGAVMAAASISTARVVGEDLVAIGEQQLVENEGQQVYLDFVRDLGPEGVTGPEAGYNQPVGFRVESYTPDQAVISLAARSPDGALSAAALTVLWQDETWKLQLLPDGSETVALTPLVNLDAYVSWGLL